MSGIDLKYLQLDATRMLALGLGFGEIVDELSVDQFIVCLWGCLPSFSSEPSGLVEVAQNDSSGSALQLTIFFTLQVFRSPSRHYIVFAINGLCVFFCFCL